MAPLAAGRGSERATPFRRICIYCGANNGRNASYVEAARDLGERLATKGIGVVYGGGRVGLMGAVADGALAAGGEVIGIIPEKLRAAEVAHHGLSELFVVDSMHARKTMMATLSDAFITLPGGFGTLEETFEVITWSQLNYHRKPVGLLNVKGYYDLLLRFFEHMVGEGLVRPEHRAFVVSAEDPDALLELLAKAEVPVTTFRIEKP